MTPLSSLHYWWTPTACGWHLTTRATPHHGDLVTTACRRITHVVAAHHLSDGDCADCRSEQGSAS